VVAAISQPHLHLECPVFDRWQALAVRYDAVRDDEQAVFALRRLCRVPGAVASVAS